MTPRLHPNLPRTLALIAIMSTAAAAVAHAQPRSPARSLDELTGRLKIGAKITVTDENGQEINGKITVLSASGLALLVDGSERQFKEDQVALVQQRRRDPEWNGALIGAAILGGLSSLPLLADVECDPSCGAVVAIYAAIGAGIGLTIDAAVREKRTIFLRPTGGSTSRALSVSPVVTRGGGGVAVGIRF